MPCGQKDEAKKYAQNKLKQAHLDSFWPWILEVKSNQAHLDGLWLDLNLPPKTAQIGLFQLDVWCFFSFTLFFDGHTVLSTKNNII